MTGMQTREQVVSGVGAWATATDVDDDLMSRELDQMIVSANEDDKCTEKTSKSSQRHTKKRLKDAKAKSISKSA
ncbi:hypothetical protein PG990_014870 [Apiospora arundinis]|uniref:Uncharacterized protein n=1 Tax=Apiospora arundinis TaxID=335852 RepID=A0ABR2HL27_9PEZI